MPAAVAEQDSLLRQAEAVGVSERAVLHGALLCEWE